MIKKFILFLIPVSFFCTDLFKAQTFTWMSGSKIANVPGIYGIKGVPSSTANPGSRFGAMNWTDNSGNFWLFGGWGRDVNDSLGILNDLWHYNPSTNQWTWIGGADLIGQPSVYGTKGLASPSNYPGGRQEGTNWVDGNGNFWMFGGVGLDGAGGFGYFHDLWKYDPLNNTWAWMSGTNFTNTPGTYSNMGVPSTTNIPGARVAAYGLYHNGMLWLLGGFGYTTINNWGFLNDLWRYNIATGEWTWMKGSVQGAPAGIYGTQGVSAANNSPGGRVYPSGWTGNGALYIFGGRGMSESQPFGELCDMWKYNISTNEWMWIKGSKFKELNGVYGVQGIGNSANLPGAREASAHWQDNYGNFWMLDGLGMSDSSTYPGPLTDLWKYNTTSNTWTWVKGSSKQWVMGNYGTKGMPSPSNLPGPHHNSNSWVDQKQNLWFFGGGGHTDTLYGGTLNDMWKFHNCYAPVQITSPQQAICPGQSATLTASGGSNYIWSNQSTNNIIVVSPNITTVYTVTSSDLNQCSYTSTFTLSVICEGVEESETSIHILLTSNPNQGSFIIESSQTLEDPQLTIYDLSGKLILQTQLKNKRNEITLPAVPGVYFYNVIDKTARIRTGKILVL